MTVIALLAGSNQGGNNLTLKGWPLTVSILLNNMMIISVEKLLLDLTINSSDPFAFLELRNSFFCLHGSLWTCHV